MMAPIRNTPTTSQEWLDPTEKHGARWIGFKMSNMQNDESRRQQAKCTHCHTIFPHGKPHILFLHIKDACRDISAEQRSLYLCNALPEAEGNENETESNNQNNGCIISVSIPQKKANPSVSPYFCPMSNEKTQLLHELLLKSLISSNLPLSYLENPYFQEYQLELAQTVYKIPRRVQTAENTLPMVHARHELALLETIKNQNQLTLSLDGWTDNSGNSIYALMALKGSKKKYFVDVRDLHAKRHTADNIFVAIKSSLKSKQIDFNKISALVTDSPLVMIKLCVSSSSLVKRISNI